VRRRWGVKEGQSKLLFPLGPSRANITPGLPTFDNEQGDVRLAARFRTDYNVSQHMVVLCTSKGKHKKTPCLLE
jgi:hypothetical protein